MREGLADFWYGMPVFGRVFVGAVAFAVVASSLLGTVFGDVGAITGIVGGALAFVVLGLKRGWFA